MQHPGKAFYEKWADDRINHPGHPAVLKWKAVNLANLYLRTLKDESVDNICEIGGADGSVLNTLGDILNVGQLKNFELSATFCKFGQEKYPKIQFINAEFKLSAQDTYSLVVLSDILEHVENDAEFLKMVAQSCRFVLMKIPIEDCLISKDWYYCLRGRRKPTELRYGPGHVNGHLRGYSLNTAEMCVSKYFKIMDREISDVFFFYGSNAKHRFVKRYLGSRILLSVYGGALFILGESKSQS